MDVLRNAVRRHGLEGACLDPEVFSPLDYFAHKKEKCVTQPFLDKMVVLDSQTVGINVFWQSSRAGSDGIHEKASLAAMHKDSFWARLIAQVFHVALPAGSTVSAFLSSLEGPLRSEDTVATKRRKTGKSLSWPALPKMLGATASLPSMPCFSTSHMGRNYTLRAFLKKGTYGSVFKAVDKRTDQFVAVKIVQSRTGNAETKEVYLHTAVLPHPNIIGVQDAFVSPYFVAIALDLADMPLHTYLYSSGVSPRTAEEDSCGVSRLTAKEVAHLAQGLVAALAHVHSHDIIHRDVHSGNVLLKLARGREPLEASVFLGDFGLACHLRRHKSGAFEAMSACVVGGCNAAPELLFTRKPLCTYSAAIDVWAWACVTVEIATGTPLFCCDERVLLGQAIRRRLGEPASAVVRKYDWKLDGSRAFPVKEVRWDALVGAHAQLIRPCFRYDFLERPSSEQCLATIARYCTPPVSPCVPHSGVSL